MDEATILWRRIRPDWVQYNEGIAKIKSQAFQNQDQVYHAFSAHDSEVAERLGIVVQAILSDFPGYGMVSITVGDALALNQKVEPFSDDTDDPTHVHVIGKKTRPVRRAFAEAAKWIVEPSSAG